MGALAHEIYAAELLSILVSNLMVRNGLVVAAPGWSGEAKGGRVMGGADRSLPRQPRWWCEQAPSHLTI